MHETGVIHGRFQVLHNDHLKYLMAGKKRCRHLIVGITNPDPSTIKKDNSDPGRSSAEANPLTYFERYCMVKMALMDEGLSPDEFSVVPLPINFPELYRYYVPMDATFFITIYDAWGEKKLEMFRKLGLKIEVMWRKPLKHKGISASHVRKLIANHDDTWKRLVPVSTVELIKKFGIEKRLARPHNERVCFTHSRTGLTLGATSSKALSKLTQQ